MIDFFQKNLFFEWSDPDNAADLTEYDHREEIYVKHSFEPLAAWTREELTDDATLCLCRYGEAAAAFIAHGERLEEIRSREDFFRAVSVAVKEQICRIDGRPDREASRSGTRAMYRGAPSHGGVTTILYVPLAGLDNDCPGLR